MPFHYNSVFFLPDGLQALRVRYRSNKIYVQLRRKMSYLVIKSILSVKNVEISKKFKDIFKFKY